MEIISNIATIVLTYSKKKASIYAKKMFNNNNRAKIISNKNMMKLLNILKITKTNSKTIRLI